MNHKQKKKLTALIAKDLLSFLKTEEIKENLRLKGLYDYDINNLIAKAKRDVHPSLKPIIKKCLLDKTYYTSVKELKNLDPYFLNDLDKEVKSELGQIEKRKVKKLLSEGKDKNEIQKLTNTEFFSSEKINNEIDNFNSIKKQQKDRDTYQGIKLAGGLGLLVFGIIISSSFVKILGAIWLVQSFFIFATKDK